MYIKELQIENFRSIEKLKLTFNKGVNIIIGENNSGKTAVIDALRICLSYGSLTRDIYIKKDEDFYINSHIPGHESDEIRFDLIFHPESNAERAIFTDLIKQDATDASIQTIELHYRYFLEVRNDKSILRWRVWGGENEGQQVPIEALQLISNTYLGALRDATEKLKPHSRGNKIARLYKNLKHFDGENEQAVNLTKIQKTGLANELKKQVEDSSWIRLVKAGNKKVLEHISHSTMNGKEPQVQFSFLANTYEAIVDNIEAIKPVYKQNGTPILGQKYFRVSQNGLGENNIIYAGTVLGDLIDRRELGEIDTYYNALLIEEPEAHLHPQKQNTFFKYLSTLQDSGIQIFITSHSPALIAKSDLDDVTIMKRDENKISAFSIRNSELDPGNKKYLAKFLDVTKSQLFFANGIIMVESISEALLLPVLSKILNEDIEKNGIGIINLNGLGFEHFAKLFNSEDEEKRLLARCILFSADDKGKISEDDFINGEISKKDSKRIYRKLKKKAVVDKFNRIQSTDLTWISLGTDISKDLVQTRLEELIEKRSDRAIIANELSGGHLKSKFAEVSFEYELLKASLFNLNLIKSLYKEMHPHAHFLSAQESIERQAYDILKKLSLNNDKSELAHRLALHLDELGPAQNKFSVPDYIASGIKWITKGEV